MHGASMREMERFAATLPERKLRIADIGARDINGCYRRFFTRWDYVGCDIVPGPNVDYVLDESDWSGAGMFDVVVSGQTLEHVQQPWVWMNHIASILIPGGTACIIAPHTFPFHEYPMDCWRVWPDGMRGLFSYAGLMVDRCYKNESDTIGIAKKPS